MWEWEWSPDFKEGLFGGALLTLAAIGLYWVLRGRWSRGRVRC